jgi:hypothetical protein
MVEPRLSVVPPAFLLALHCLRMVPGVREALDSHSVLTVSGAVGVLIKAIDGVDPLSALPVLRAVRVLQRAWQVCVVECYAIHHAIITLHPSQSSLPPPIVKLRPPR